MSGIKWNRCPDCSGLGVRNAPEYSSAIGPYSQAIKWGDLVFVSGQIALSSDADQVEGDIRDQTRNALSNLRNILEAAGSSLNNVLKTTVFLVDIKDFPAMNEVYSTFFRDVPPARSTFAVTNLPKGASVEIEAIAALY